MQADRAERTQPHKSSSTSGTAILLGSFNSLRLAAIPRRSSVILAYTGRAPDPLPMSVPHPPPSTARCRGPVPRE
eukprot:6651692-Lingulodinium_polyedra.AAC.1